jgi:toxin ParE1/3/4
MIRQYDVRLTAGAEQDLRGLHAFRMTQAGREAADALLADIASTAGALATFPDRGSIPLELQALGMTEYRQTLCKPYRILYRVVDTTVFVVLICDGRRDMQSLLERRLLTR